ncbi:MAG: hypothetical protein IPJ97_08195 [Proteobacteria bacterium]|nr:hypothetical protein [Pseudomonadota bacterium]
MLIVLPQLSAFDAAKISYGPSMAAWRNRRVSRLMQDAASPDELLRRTVA